MHEVEDPDERIVRRGLQAPYHWLTATGDVYMGTLMEVCPEAVLNRYLAVTSFDSGVRRITEDERLAGWHLRGDIAYSPRVASVQSLSSSSGTGSILRATTNGTCLRLHAIWVRCSVATRLNFSPVAAKSWCSSTPSLLLSTILTLTFEKYWSFSGIN